MADTEERAPAPPAGGSGLDLYFKITERGSSVGTEIRAGVTTFLVMSYIIFVNPTILAPAWELSGITAGAIAAGTALVAGILSIAMGVFAKYPLAMAAGLGLNAAVAFGLVLTDGLTPEGAMGVIVWEGLIVAVLVLVGMREAIMDAVPLSLKRAIGVGIGLFILFIGFVTGELIVLNVEDAPVTFAFPNSPGAWTTLIGLAIVVLLYARKVPGALIISIIATAIIALILGVATVPDQLALTPSFDTFGQIDMGNAFTVLGGLAAVLTIFSFMLTDFFDTMGTATGIVEQAELTDEEGNIPGIGTLLLVDSLGAAAGGAAGVSSNTSYIESASGVAEGGKTGLTSVVVGILFLAAIFVTPLAELVPRQATAPALILVGFLMAGLIKGIDFTDFEEGFPALLAIVLMPLTFSITVGIGAGFLMHTLIKVVKGKARDLHPLMWVVAVAFLIYFGQAVINTAISA
ncbi:MAG TPA: NCS2 family permease [Acidimicrobiia bacterium]|nr:NCS2 family permease [Acidimicrobiia bacterium]